MPTERPLRVISAILTADGPLPVCPYEQTLSGRPGMSKKCHLLTLGAGVSGGAKYPHIADEHRAVEVRQAIDPYTNKPETMSFHSRRFAGRSHDHIIVAQTRSPLMNQHASKTSVPPSVGAQM